MHHTIYNLFIINILMLLTLLVPKYCMAASSTEYNTSIVFADNPIGSDEYGRVVYEVNITTKIKNYIVPTMLARPIENNGIINHIKNYTINDVTTTGNVKFYVDGDSPVYNEKTLDPNGGSGQRPFLLPNSVAGLSNGTRITLWFAEADGNTPFDPSSNSRFFPLDVERELVYTNQGNPSDCSGFFGFFTCTIDWFFETTIGVEFFGSATDTSISDQQKRQKYLANILYGIDKPHLIKKNGSVDTTTPAVNRPLSLLHYEEISGSGCYIGFFDFSSSSLTCTFIKTFAFDKWMPFVTVEEDNELFYSRIQEDTRIMLTTLMGYKARKKQSSFFSTFLSQFFKPVTFFLSWLFPSGYGIVSDAIDVNLTTNKPPLLILPISDSTGKSIETLETFKLISLHEIAAKEIAVCEERNVWFIFSSSWRSSDPAKCQNLINEAIDEATTNNNTTPLTYAINALSTFFSFIFPSTEFRGSTRSATKLGITIERYTPSIAEGNAIYQTIDINQTGSMQ